jgi:hypothetical protein
MKEPHIPDLKLYYGDDFQYIHEELIQALEKKRFNWYYFSSWNSRNWKNFLS